MDKKTVLTAIISIVLTTLLVWAVLFFFFPGPDTTELEEQNQILLEENEILLAQVDEYRLEVEALTELMTEFQTDNEGLIAEIRDLQQENAEAADQTPSPANTRVISRIPREGWEQYFPTAESTTLTEMTTQEVEELLGYPPYQIRSEAADPSYSREIWIYMAGEEDPTALYLFFKDNQLWQSRLDEFNGFPNSGLLDREEFWLE